MYTIKLSELLAKNHGIDQRVAQRLGTMHYFLNRHQPEQYRTFLSQLAQYEDAEQVESAMRQYLRRQQLHRRSTMSMMVKVCSHTPTRRNDTRGNYVIEGIVDANANTGIQLKLGRWVAHVLYIIMLGFTKEGLPWKANYLDSKNKQEEIHKIHKEQIESLIRLIYGTGHDADDFIKTIKAYSITTHIRDAVRQELTNAGKESLLYWFAPHDLGCRRFVIPMAPSAIIMPTELRCLFRHWCQEIKHAQMANAQPYDIEDLPNAEEVVSEVMASFDNVPTDLGATPSIAHQDEGLVSLDECARWIERQYNTDDPRAINALALIYEHRAQAAVEGADALTRGNAQAAFDLWQRLADMGDRQGQFRLATYYLMGKCVEQDFDMALMWLKKAVDQGHADATWLCGKCCQYGLATAQDLGKAFELYQQAAQHGSAGAARDAANCLMQGIGTDRDVLKAYEYLMIAADKDPIVQEFCKELMGSNWQRPLPEHRANDMVALYHATDWLSLSFHFDPETQVGERELMELMYNFRRLGSNYKQERVLDLLDRFHYIVGDRHWIDHVNEALHLGLTSREPHVVELRKCNNNDELSYDATLHLSNGDSIKLTSLFNRPNALITYLIVVAFSARYKDGFTQSYAEEHAGKCRALWAAFDRQQGNDTDRLVKEYLLNYIAGISADRMNRNYATNLAAVNHSLAKRLGKAEARYFQVPDRVGDDGLHYRRIPEGTKIILPREIEDILNGTEQNRGQLSE